VLQEMTIDRVGSHSTQRVDVRIIAATNRSLRTLVGDGRFRMDLFYRLNCLDVRVPPLRSRRGDIPELVSLFLGRHADRPGTTVSPEAMEALMQYDWPGNVRELERVIQRASILAESSCITLDDLPPAVSARYLEIFQPALDHGETLRALMARYVRLMLHRCSNNKRETCRRLDISYHTLQAYLRLAAREQGAASAVRAIALPEGEEPAGDPVVGLLNPGEPA
jgi:transcriptional regulator with PAS, ATPase and Fis domain